MLGIKKMLSRRKGRRSALSAVRQAAAWTLDRLEDRTLLSLTMNHTPYLQLGDAPLGAATDQVEVVWQTRGAVGTGEAFTLAYNRVGQAPQQVPVTRTDIAGSDRITWSAVLSGLDYLTGTAPNYEYLVTLDRPAPQTDDTWTGSFRTRLAPEDTAPFRFAAFGDTADPNVTVQDRFRAVGKQAALGSDGTDPRFWLSLGDNINPDGTFDQVDYRLNPGPNYAGTDLTGYFRNHIDFFAYGNHDVNSSTGNDPRAANAAYSPPLNGIVDSHGTGSYFDSRSEHSFSFDYGDVHFVTFDTNFAQDNPDADGWKGQNRNADLLAASLNWLANDLAATDRRWKVVFLHHPILAEYGHSFTTDHRYYQETIGVLRQYGVDLLFDSHTHNYQRSHPLNGATSGQYWVDEDASPDVYSEGEGVIQTLVGTGGRNLTNTGSSGYDNTHLRYYNTNVFGWAETDVTANSLTVRFMGSTNPVGGTFTELDEFTINQAGSDTTAPFAALAAPQDNAPWDLDPAVDRARISTPENIQIRLADGYGDGIDDDSVTANLADSGLVVLKDGLLLPASQYSAQYDAATNRITIAPAGGGTLGNGYYEVTVGAGAHPIRDQAGNPMAPKVLITEIDTYIPLTQVTQTFRQGQNGYTAAEDTWIQGNATTGTTTDRSASTTLRVDQADGTYEDQFLLRFNDIFQPAGPIPLGVNVTSAKLTLRTDTASGAETDDRAWFYRFMPDVVWNHQNNWTTFSTGGGGIQPGVEVFATADARGGSSTTNRDTFVNVTASLRAWSAGDTNNGWAVLHGGQDDGWRIQSAEGTNKPLLSVTYEVLTARLTDNLLEIIGTDLDDQITVTVSNGTVLIGTTDTGISAALVHSMQVIARGGNDTITLTDVTSTAFPALTGQILVLGGAGADTLIGGPLAETLDGGMHDDNINGGAGNDRLSGGAANDVLAGSAGNDTLVGDAGRDDLDGGLNSDTVDYSTYTTATFPVSLNNLFDDANEDDNIRSSNEVVRRPIPPGPTTFNASKVHVNGWSFVTWSGNYLANDVMEIWVKQNGVWSLKDTAQAKLNYRYVYGLNWNTTYDMKIRARSYVPNYSAYSAEIHLTPATVPQTPQNLAASPINGGSSLLTWIGSYTSENLEIEMAASASGPFYYITAAQASTLSKQIGSLTAGRAYYFRARAANAQGLYSGYSNVAQISGTVPVPSTPSSVWLDGSVLYWSGGPYWIDPWGYSFCDIAQIEASSDGGQNWWYMGETYAAYNAYYVSSIQSNYRVRIRNAAGQYSDYAYLNQPSTVPTPQNLWGEPVNSWGSTSLYWSGGPWYVDPSSFELSDLAHIYMSTNGTDFWEVGPTTYAAYNVGSPYGLSQGTDYWFRVRVSDRFGNWSDFSDTVFIDGTPGNNGAPETPQGLWGFWTELNYIELNWSGNYFEGDQVEVWKSSDGVNYVLDHSTHATYLYTGVYSVSPGQTYYFRVRAFNDFGFSDFAETTVWA